MPASNNHQAQYLIAATYFAVQDADIDTVILICQGDERQFYGIALPLDINCNKNFIAMDCLTNFSKNKLFRYYQAPFAQNESIRLQSKFLHFYMKQVKIVPLLVGSISQKEADLVADKIIAESSLKTLIVINSDFGSYQNIVHYNPCTVSKKCKIYDRDGPFIQMVQSVGFKQKNEIEYQMVSSVFTLICITS